MRAALAAVAGIAVLASAAWLTARGAAPAPAAPAAAASTGAFRVTRGDVTQRVVVAGTLRYDGDYQVVDQLPAGILTAAAEPGAAVERGGTLFTVSGTAAALFLGAIPAYRDFAPGMTDGPDVRELEENLVALGLDPGRAIAVDDQLTRATTAAIVRWQAARGVPAARRTGVVHLGEVVFLPGAVRVERRAAAVGTSVAPGAAILTGTSTTQVVAVQVTTDRQFLVHVGDHVQVSLPTGGGAVGGTVTRIGRVASANPAAVPGTSAPPTVPVTVALQPPPGSADLEQAPVQVSITTARRQNVLVVPITALMAKPGAGYQVRVVGGVGARLVDVRPGLYDDGAGTVEVAGDGLAEGMTVEVPAP